MRRFTASAVTAIALGLALGGCGPVNRGVESVNQPVVSRTDYVFDVTAGGGGLAAGEADRLGGWFQSLRLGYGDRIAIDDTSRYGRPDARDAVAEVAGRYGLLLSADAPVTAGTPGAGQIRVVVSRSNADVPDCPNWRSGANSDFASSTAPNYGCATNKNLAAMIANPEDLVRGQTGDGAGDPLATAKAIKAYRDTAPTGTGGALKSESTGGK